MNETQTDRHDRLRRIERQLRWHRRVGALGVVLACGLLVAAFQQGSDRQRFAKLEVERLDVVEPDGQLVLTLANTDRLPDPLIDGRTVETGRTGPGVLFYNGKGWEVGGIGYGTRETEDGYVAGSHFAFDQYHNDQVVYLNYSDDGSHKSAGLHVVDRARELTADRLVEMREEMQQATPEAREALVEEFRASVAQRVFVGSRDETAMVQLRDLAGRERIRMFVDPEGAARLELLDEEGEVVASLPE